MEYWTCFLKLYVRLSLCLNNVLKETYLCLFRFCRFDFGDLTNIRVGVKVLARSVVVHRTHWTSLCHSFTTSGPTHPDHWIREDSFLLLSLTHTQSTPPPHSSFLKCYSSIHRIPSPSIRIRASLPLHRLHSHGPSRSFLIGWTEPRYWCASWDQQSAGQQGHQKQTPGCVCGWLRGPVCGNVCWLTAVSETASRERE